MRDQRDMSILFITHDLGVIAEIADDVLVMFRGEMVEYGSIIDIFSQPRHPYTKGLLASLPATQGKRAERLHTIPGNVPSILKMPTLY